MILFWQTRETDVWNIWKNLVTSFISCNAASWIVGIFKSSELTKNTLKDLSFCLFVFFVYLSIYCPSVCLSTSLCVCVYVCLFVCLSACLSVSAQIKTKIKTKKATVTKRVIQCILELKIQTLTVINSLERKFKSEF